MQRSIYAQTNKSGQLVDPKDVVEVRQVSNAHTSEYIYYECQKINTSNQVINCTYEENRVVPIVHKPSDYKFSVQRIEASLIDVPMFNSDDKILTVTCTFDPEGITVTETVNIGTTVDVYNIDQVIPLLNTALFNAYAGVITAYDAIYGPGAWAANPLLAQSPFGVKYDEIADRLVIYADVLNVNSRPLAVGLIFNDAMIELFRGNAYTLANPYRLLFTRGFEDVNVVTLNSLDFVQNVASYTTTPMWYSIKQIVVISERLGARLVNIGTPGISGQSVTRSIILDFNYVIDNSSNAPGTRLQYLSNNNRWTDLLKDPPINSVDFSLYYRTRSERLIPIKLRPGESFSILCVFAKTLTT